MQQEIAITMDDVVILLRSNPLFAAQLENIGLRRINAELLASLDGHNKKGTETLEDSLTQ